MPLDLLVSGGRIATLAGDRGFGWVEAVRITDGRVACRLRRGSRDAGRSHTRGSSSIPTRSRSRGSRMRTCIAEGGLSLDRIDLSATPTHSTRAPR
jgi:hypothetical protein